MKIAFVIPRSFLCLCEKIVKEMQPHVQETYLLYDDYKESPGLIGRRQKEWDGIIFAGKAPYYYTKKVLYPEVLWGFFPGEGSTLFRALLVAFGKKWNIGNLSIDSYTQELVGECYQEICAEALPQKQFIYVGDVTDPLHNDYTLEFHRENYRVRKADGCITRLYSVYEQLKKDKIPAIFAGPTYDSAREQIHFMRRLYNTQKSLHNNFSILLVSIDFPPEYSLVLTYEYQYALERVKIATHVYQYAKRVEGTVIEKTLREFLIFSDRSCVEEESQGFQHIGLLDELVKSTVYPVHIGVGCGASILSAQERAVKALLRARKTEINAAYYLLSDDVGALIRPFAVPKVETMEDDRLLQVARTSGIKLETAYKIYLFLMEKRSDMFTSRELASRLKINIRSVNRLVEKLEQARFLTVCGQNISGEKGRPSRVLRFSLERRSLSSDNKE